MHFRLPQKVLFKHCDPAGIVFYPRYFEMINDAVETMFSEVLDWPFEDMHPNAGVPTAAFNVTFTAPSRHGDHLDLVLTIQRLGTSSMTLQTTAMADQQVRFVAEQTLVCIDQHGRPNRWPGAVREKVETLIEGGAR